MRREDINALPKLVQQYLVYIEAIKEHSELSVLEYAGDLRTFFRYLVKEKGLSPADVSYEDTDISKIDLDFIKSITLNDAYQFLIYCKNERRNNEATRARRVVSIRRFFTYLTDNLGLLETNPMKTLDTPKIKKSLPKYLTLDEAQRLLSVIDGKFKERDFAIITLFLNCGMRLAELVSIDYNDIRSDNTLTITGKGNKERTVYLNNACIDAIDAYMKVRPNEGVKDRALFLSARNQRISPSTSSDTLRQRLCINTAMLMFCCSKRFWATKISELQKFIPISPKSKREKPLKLTRWLITNLNFNYRHE